MKIEEVRAMKVDEMHAKLEEQRRHLYDLRSQAVTEKLEDPTRVRKTRKDIARLLTVLRQHGQENIKQRQASLTAAAARR